MSNGQDELLHMDTPPAPTSPHEPEDDARPRRGVRVELAAVVTVLVAMALLVAGLIGYGLAGNPTPGDTSPEAGFARDMQTHHQQAVEMAFLIRDRSTDPTIRSIAYDIITGQQQQAGQMFGWLTQWGLSQTSSQPRMAWMRSGSGHQMSGMQAAPSDASMPGMASAADLENLRAADGVAAERLFLRLMIAHHRGGIQMAEAIQPLTTRSEVKALARSIATAQAAEITQMTALLAAR